MVMSYQEARDWEQKLRGEFSEDAIKAEVTGGLPENPAEFDLEAAIEEFEKEHEDDEAEYDGPRPVGDPWIRV
ncbi:MAG: hypothetical protein ABEK50_18105, partial [bacterium]